MHAAPLHRSTSARRLARRTAAASAAAILTAVALSGPAVAASVPAGGSSPYMPTQGSPLNPTTQGIIMSDGRICNPRWGC